MSLDNLIFTIVAVVLGIDLNMMVSGVVAGIIFHLVIPSTILGSFKGAVIIYQDGGAVLGGTHFSVQAK